MELPMNLRLLCIPFAFYLTACDSSEDEPPASDAGAAGSGSAAAGSGGIGTGGTFGGTGGAGAGGAAAGSGGIVMVGEPLEDLVAISAGGIHTCAIRDGGQVLCWGDNRYGQLGDGTTTSSPTAVPVVGVTDATAIGLGVEFSCALRDSGEVACWGRNVVGQLGNHGDLPVTAPREDSAEPVMVSDLDDAVSLHVGPLGACVVREGGSVACWGVVADTIGISASGGVVPKVRAGVNDARELAAGNEHACVLHESSKVSCWGDRTRGQLGDGIVAELRSTDMLISVADLEDAVAIDGGDWNVGFPVRIKTGFTCAVRETGAVVCWGANDLGQLGDQTLTADVSGTPVRAGMIDDAVAISAGHFHACALSESGAVACWGLGSSGQLGGRNRDDGLNDVTGLDDAVAISAGGTHSCALRADATAVCWGANGKGELGDGTTTQRFTPSVVVTPD
jgi:alpha-tubulin suppressor-like RCC1 family protein